VPEAWVDFDGDACELKRDYDSTEVAVAAGEVFWVEVEESGWAFGRRANGDRGWVPLDRLQAV